MSTDVRSWHVRDVTPVATRAAAIKGGADIPARTPFMLRPRCRTLRALSCSDPYYERISLLPAPARSAGHCRVYDTSDVRRLAFIRRARELGFTLDEVRALLALSANDRQDTCAQVRELAAGHLAEVRAKIADLRAMEHVLADRTALHCRCPDVQ